MEQNIKQLFDKYVSGAASVEETRQLYDYFETTGNSEELDGLIENYLQPERPEAGQTAEEQLDRVTTNAWVNIKAKLPAATSRKRSILQFRWIAAAAAALLVIGMTITFMVKNNEPPAPKLTSKYGSDVMPGTNKATLTLSNGQQYELKDNQAGLRTGDGGISYRDGEQIASTDQVTEARIHVPNGGTYTVILSDGTKVQLNSGSDLSYPTRFTGKERLVQLTGEGYFEVSHNASKPFKVQSGPQVVTVLGTHFNIHAYGNEPIETTLLEGKVSVNALLNSAKGTVLTPGLQASFEQGQFKVRKVTADDYVCWTRNLFVFNHLSLPQIFKHLERWYDVEINYPSNLSKETYLMEIPKDRKLSEILEPISDLTGVSFKIQGRRITAKQQ
ncbi:FecR domain-containing protein [Sphingobacterium sp.]|uniref:FecR family protein n=1 Tax=Sphingobacterium sp. TaxID=341027 RepID=UPI0031CDD3B7